MALGAAFLHDVWNGHVWLRQFTYLDSDHYHHSKKRPLSNHKKKKNAMTSWSCWIVTEWLALVALIGVPLVTLIGTLLAHSDEWWKITLLTWFSSVTVYYVVFATMLVALEVQAAWLILRAILSRQQQNGGPADKESAPTVWYCLTQAIFHRQLYQYSGLSEFHARFTTQLDEPFQDKDHETDGASESLPPDVSIVPNVWARFTLLCGCTKVLETLSQPERVYSLSEILGTRRFLTAQNWSLEKLFCTMTRYQTVAVVRAHKHHHDHDAALHPLQVRSSWICNIVCIGLVLLLVIAALVWMEASVLVILLLALVIALACCMGQWRSSQRMYRLYETIQHEHEEQLQEEERNTDSEEKPEDGSWKEFNKNGKEDDDEAIYQVYDQYRLTRPSPAFAWFMFVLEMAIYAICILFIVLCIISVVRYYLNPGIFLQEYGSMKDIYNSSTPQGRAPSDEDNPNNVSREEQSSAHSPDQTSPVTASSIRSPPSPRLWNSQSRLYNILTHVTQGPSRTSWIYVFGVLVLGVVLFTVGALSESAEDSVSDADEIVLLPRDNFTYPSQPNLPYPTCGLAKGLGVPLGNFTALSDCK